MPNAMATLPNILAPSVQHHKVWLTPTTRVPCCNAAKTPNPLKFDGVPQTRQHISAAGGPKLVILWEHVEKMLLFNKFFTDCRLMPLLAKIQHNTVVRWCPDGDFLRHFHVLYFQRATCSTFQTFADLYRYRVLGAWSCKALKILEQNLPFEKTPLTGRFSKFWPERIHRDMDPRVVCKFREIWPMGSRWNLALLSSPKNFSPWSLAVTSASIAPKICQGQLQTMYSRSATNFIQIGSSPAE